VSLTVALDAMGGDYGVSVVVPAALRALDAQPDLDLVLVGDRAEIEAQLQRNAGAASARLKIHHASEQVEMDEPPSQALRGKKDSSMRVTAELVKGGEADACVSAGNTGALMAIARFVLKTLPGIDRPAIISALPAITGHTHVLDLGANVDSSPEHLRQFAIMGSVLVSAVDNTARPTVGLLNIGEEAMKGNERVKEAAPLLAASDINYVGFVEGDDIYKGTVNVVVCDGFVGNVALKSSEGVARMITHFLRQEIERNAFTRLAGLIALPALRGLRRRTDPRSYNGASFVGLRGIVIKSHGGADILAFERAISEAVAEIRKDIPRRINAHIESLLGSREAG